MCCVSLEIVVFGMITAPHTGCWPADTRQSERPSWHRIRFTAKMSVKRIVNQSTVGSVYIELGISTLSRVFLFGLDRRG